MKEFVFSLEPLRVLREQKEHAAQQRYARSLDTCRKAESLLQKAVAELTTGRSLLQHELASGVTAGQLAGLRNWCLTLEIRWREQQAALNEARRIAGLLYREMTAATRDRESLDHFRDKARRAHESQIRRVEQKMLDEMAIQRSGISIGLPFAGRESFQHA